MLYIYIIYKLLGQYFLEVARLHRLSDFLWKRAAA